MTYSLDGYPLHRLNTGHMRGWLCLPVIRREMASFLAKTYRTGVVVLNPTLRAFATVDPRGNITELPPPHRKFEFHQISNKPRLDAGECACRNYWDPESEGRWGDREEKVRKNEHHPHCQCRQASSAAWDLAKLSAETRVAEGRSPQARPDEWERQVKEIEGTGEIRSR